MAEDVSSAPSSECVTLPAIGAMRPFSTLTSVDFPAPEGPTIAVSLPAGICKVTSRSTRDAPRLTDTHSSFNMPHSSQNYAADDLHAPAFPG